MMAASAVLPPGLARVATVTRARANDDLDENWRTAESDKNRDLGARRKRIAKDRLEKEVPPDPKFAPFLGEKTTYDVSFLWTFNAAKVTVTFQQGSGDEYITEMDARTTGVVEWATNLKRQFVKSRLVMKDDGGVKRLICTHMTRISEKGGTTTKSISSYHYDKGKRFYRRMENGELKKQRVYKMPKNVYYQDFVGFWYNLRAGMFGKIEKGQDYKIRTIPYKGIDEYTIHVATTEEMAEEKGWLRDNPDAVYMGTVKLHEKVFGIKAREGKMLTDKDFFPMAGKINDVVAYGDVHSKLTSRSKTSPRTSS